MLDSKGNPSTPPCNVQAVIANDQKLCHPILPLSNIPKIWDCESCKYINLAETEASNQEKSFSLEDFSGKTVFVFFYQGDFKPGSQEMIESLALFSSSSSLMKNAQIVAISTDKVKTHKDFAYILNWGEVKKNTANILLVSDKNGYISRKFGVLQVKNHTALMSLFIVGPDGVLKGSRVWGKDLQPNAEELKKILTQYIQSEDVQESISDGNRDESIKNIQAQGGGIRRKSQGSQEIEVKDINSATMRMENNEEIEKKEAKEEVTTKIGQYEGWPIPRLDKIKSSQESKIGGISDSLQGTIL